MGAVPCPPKRRIYRLCPVHSSGASLDGRKTEYGRPPLPPVACSAALQDGTLTLSSGEAVTLRLAYCLPEEYGGQALYLCLLLLQRSSIHIGNSGNIHRY